MCTTALRLLSDSPKVGDVRIAIRNLLSLKPQDAGALADLPAVRRMSARQKIELASDFYSSDSGCEFVYALLREIPSDQDLTAPDRIAWASNFALACIRTKRFQEAVEILSASLSRDQPEIELTFNRAIAIWGQEGIAPVDEFRRVIGCESTRPERGHYPNYLQCIAIAAYVSGDIERALGLTERAKRLAQQRPTTHFSAWRYLNVSPREFARDCDDMHRQMVAGEALSFPAIRALVSHLAAPVEDRRPPGGSAGRWDRPACHCRWVCSGLDLPPGPPTPMNSISERPCGFNWGASVTNGRAAVW